MKKALLILSCFIGMAVPNRAAVTFVANDLTTDARWRSADVQKMDDIDGDNVYGTAGYYLAAGLRAGYKAPFLTDNMISGTSNPDDVNTLPSWIVSLEYTDPAERGRSWGGDGGNFGALDNVGGGHTGFTGAPILRSAIVPDPMSLTLKRANSPAFRLTLILGNNPSEGGFNDPEGQQITVDDGSGAVTQISGLTDFYSQTTYQLWDIPAGGSDITLVFQGMPLGTGIARLSGIAIDTLATIPASITRPPVGGMFLAGIPFSLSVTAAGTPPLTYQWLKNSAVIPDASEATLAFASLASGDAATYQAVVSNAGGSVTSSPVVLQVAAALPVKTANYENAVQSELSIFAYYPFNNVTADDVTTAHNGSLAGQAIIGEGLGGGADKAVVLNGSGHVNLGVSEDFDFTDATGSVEAWIRADWDPAAPPNYNPTIFANRGGGPTRWSLHMMQGKAQIAFWNGSQIALANIPGSGTVWHHVVSVFDTENWLLYWDGELIGTYPISLGGATAQPTQIGSAAEAATQEGWVGAIDEVAVYADALGVEAIQAHYLAFVAGDPPAIVTQPQGGFFLAGLPVTLKVTVSGPPPLTYKWYKNTAVVPGAEAATLSFAAVASADAGTYQVVVSNPGGSVTSSPVVVQIAAALPPKLVNYENVLQTELSIFSFYSFNNLTADDLSAKHNGVLTDQADFATGIGGGADKAVLLTGRGHVNLGVSEDFDFTDTTGSVEAWIRADWAANPGYNPTVFASRASNPTLWSIHMAGDKSQMAFWNGSQVAWVSLPANASTNWHHFVSVFDNGSWLVYWDGQPLATSSISLGSAIGSPTQIGSAAETATQEGWVGAIDEVAFYADALSPEAVLAHYDAFFAGDPPLITTQPQGGTYLVGADVTLSVKASGPQLSYQWFRNGVLLPDATSENLVFSGATPDNSGTYTVVVSNTTAVATSSSAVVVVVTPDFAAYRAAVRAQANLISFYPFDDDTANDVVSANHGTLVGTAEFAPGLGGEPNKSLLLTGGQVTLGQVDAFNFANQVGTVELLLRADWTSSPGYNPTIFADREGGPVNYSIHMMAAKNQIAFWNGTAAPTINIPSAGTGWHHLAVVFNAGQWSVYWDGQHQSTQALGLGSGADAPTNLGSASSTGGEQWLGALDEAAFYSTALSAETIQAQYGALLKAAPTLHFQRNGNQLSITWTGSNFKLQANSNLANSAGWQDVAAGDTSPASVTMGGTGNQFFRLINK